MAVWITARRLIVGVSADDLLVSKAHPEQLEPIQTRISRTRAFLESLDDGLEYEIVELRDVAGPTGESADVQALVIREGKGFPPLDMFVIDVISSSSESLNDLAGTSDDENEGVHAAALGNDGLTGETDQERLKAGKMSSTMIRRILAHREAALESGPS
ncbi:hypothetical protein QFC21_006701 [Naganishia friedmannii]|uniref:Uncharacterized protein n=1 Tax=Naganishia friedmannii TaxID=89922 RepID=A0ACC2V130_9TREE|nr:hypothetical protein QFC21_006701 [Naganishia friedmannii]